MESLKIPDSWMPTEDNLNALPTPLRRYIHYIHANVDPAGTMRENFRLRQENAALKRAYEMLVAVKR
jgi:hypothetical protein